MARLVGSEGRKVVGRALLRLLGPMELELGGVVQQLGGPRQRAVLAMLALEPNRVISVDRIIVDLWEDDDRRQPRNNVQVYVSNLRRALRPCADHLSIVAAAGGYRLEVDDDVIDYHVFRRELDQSRKQSQRGLAAAAARSAASALELWRGPFLADLGTKFDVLAAAADRAENERLDATEQWFEAELDLGGGAELIAELEKTTMAHPMRERFWGQLMIALARAGRQRDALLAYQRARKLLANEAGLEPGKELRAIEVALLSGELPLVPVATGAHLAFSDVHGAVIRVPLTAGEVYTLGRGPSADISIPWDARASRTHARLWHADGTWRVQDSGSTNGTFLNGTRIVGDAVVNFEDVLLVGSTACSLRDSRDARVGALSPSDVTFMEPGR